jgi:hypothetical protein
LLVPSSFSPRNAGQTAGWFNASTKRRRSRDQSYGRFQTTEHFLHSKTHVLAHLPVRFFGISTVERAPGSAAYGVRSRMKYRLSFAKTTYVIDFVDFFARSQETLRHEEFSAFTDGFLHLKLKRTTRPK